MENYFVDFESEIDYVGDFLNPLLGSSLNSTIISPVRFEKEDWRYKLLSVIVNRTACPFCFVGFENWYQLLDHAINCGRELLELLRRGIDRNPNFNEGDDEEVNPPYVASSLAKRIRKVWEYLRIWRQFWGNDANDWRLNNLFNEYKDLRIDLEEETIKNLNAAAQNRNVRKGQRIIGYTLSGLESEFGPNIPRTIQRIIDVATSLYREDEDDKDYEVFRLDEGAEFDHGSDDSDDILTPSFDNEEKKWKALMTRLY